MTLIESEIGYESNLQLLLRIAKLIIFMYVIKHMTLTPDFIFYTFNKKRKVFAVEN